MASGYVNPNDVEISEMAKAKKNAAPAAPVAPKVNLFAKAVQKAAEKPKKPKGTVITLPKNLDGEGKLVGDSAILNQAVTEAIEAGAEEKTAKNKGALAKGRLMTYAQSEVVKLNAQLGVLPPTPINVVNHKGESVTYIMADKSQQNPIGAEQISLLETLLGEDGAAKIIQKRNIISFNFETMDKQAANEPSKTVFDIVAEVVNDALLGDPRLSTEQKESLLVSTEKTYLQPNTICRSAELCSADAAQIAQFFEAIGSACVRSIKV
jgi:hypothetical protein